MLVSIKREAQIATREERTQAGHWTSQHVAANATRDKSFIAYPASTAEQIPPVTGRVNGNSMTSGLARQITWPGAVTALKVPARIRMAQ